MGTKGCLISETMEIEAWKQSMEETPTRDVPETHEGLVDYLRTHASMYKAHNMFGDPKDAPIRIGEIYDWIIENGVCLTGLDLEKSESQAFFAQSQIKQCYYNSMMAQSLNRELEYWEGWAAGIIPTNHAWNVQDNSVIDLTWSKLDYMRDNPEQVVYFGVAIPREFVQERLFKETRFKPSGVAGPYLWDYAVHQIIEEKKQHSEKCEAFFEPQEEGE